MVSSMAMFLYTYSPILFSTWVVCFIILFFVALLSFDTNIFRHFWLIIKQMAYGLPPRVHTRHETLWVEETCHLHTRLFAMNEVRANDCDNPRNYISFHGVTVPHFLSRGELEDLRARDLSVLQLLFISLWRSFIAVLQINFFFFSLSQLSSILKQKRLHWTRQRQIRFQSSLLFYLFSALFVHQSSHRWFLLSSFIHCYYYSIYFSRHILFNS